MSISIHEQTSRPHSPPGPETCPPLTLPDQYHPQLSIPFKLQLIQNADPDFEVRALDTPLDEPQATSRLPYTTDEFTAVQRLCAELLDITREDHIIVRDQVWTLLRCKGLGFE